MSKAALPSQRIALGSALALIGLAVLALAAKMASSDTLRFWLTQEWLRPIGLLPLAGFGVALGQKSWVSCITDLLVFLAGMTIGITGYRTLLEPLWAIPDITAHEFLAGPISALAAGLLLVTAGKPVLAMIATLSAFVLGSATAVGIVITDPSLNDWTIRIAGCVGSLWVLASVGVMVSGLPGAWSRVAGPILGSWLVAIGLLYGGFALMPKPGRQVRPAPLRDELSEPLINSAPRPGDGASDRPPP